jgi:N-acetylmuramoyl-L-alanine amidase
MRIKQILIILFFIAASVNAQRFLKITVQIDGETEYLSYVNRRGTAYVSSKELANILSGNYYYNSDAQKVELKFNDYRLKVTAKNQFVILLSRETGEKKVYQLPISTMLIRDDVFIPLIYMEDYINLAYGKKLFFDDGSKNLRVTSKNVDTFAEFKKDKPKEDLKPPKRVKKKKVDSKYDIYGMSIEEKTNGTLIRINSQREIHRYSSNIQEGKLFLFLSGVSVDPNITSRAQPNGLVRNIKRKDVSGNVQLEFKLESNYSDHETFKDVESNDLMISIHNKLLSNLDKDLKEKRKDWKFDKVVIDPGHGGKDPGAIGVTGTKEKDINLAIGNKLGKLIETKMDSVEVIYTRKTDKFVELYKRGKIANEADAKLFISIHANSLHSRRSNVRGFEVYLLRPGRTEEAIEIAEIENSVIKYEENPDRYKKLTDENFILVTMAHSANMRYSEKFSEILHQEWTGSLAIPSRGVKQAGFYVLVGASMPGVLVESGFLTNRQDEAYLKSESGQQEIAETMYKAVKKYKEYYDKQINGKSK